MKKNNISEIIEDIKKGKMVIIVDDESRENDNHFAFFNIFNYF